MVARLATVGLAVASIGLALVFVVQPADGRPATTGFAPLQGRIAMSVTTHGGCWVVMREIGSDMWQSLTPGLAAGEKRCDGRATSWSPDGTKVAFTREGIRPGRSGIFVTALDGGLKRVRQLTSEQASSTVPLSWSPDGTQLAYDPWGAFECDEFLDDPKAVLRFEIADLSGRPPRTVRVVPGPDDVGSSIMGQIEWSGDGTRLAFTTVESLHSDSRCETEIGSTYVVAAPGAATHRLTKRTSFGAWVQPGGHPASAWSPVGDSLLHVYCADFANEACRLETLHPGTGQRNALGKIGVYYGADTAWTPDGRSVLVFAAMFPQGPHKLRKVDRATGRAADLRSWPDPATVPDQLLAVTDSSVVLLTRLGLSDDGLTFRAVKLTTVPLDGGPPNSMTIMPPSGSRINDFDLLLMG